MKKLLLLLITLIGSDLVAQQSSSKYLLSAGASIEKHDKRLFNYNEKKLLLNEQPENWGTYGLQISIYRKLNNASKVTFYAGLGLEYERFYHS
jgi:hypothetical protein